MDIMKQIDPELAPSLEMIPADGSLNFDNMAEARKMSHEIFSRMASMMPVVKGVNSRDVFVPGPERAPDIMVRVYTPETLKGMAPGMLWIHGGGFILGDLTADDYMVRSMCLNTGCIIVSTNYRLAPENPFPAPVEDCYASLKWMVNNAKDLGIDKTRVAIGGGSAGGGLAAGLALMTRDRGEIALSFQLLVYPMLDDRNITPSSHAITDPRTWDREKNIFAWSAYLGESAKDGIASPYAAASRAKELSGMPAAYIAVGELDLFLDENIEYAQRLLQAGVAVELHVYPGATHGFDSVINASVAKRFIQERDNAIIRALR
ncbi:MAG: alpha/beta hydrolase [Deltaproteobacteria bacterium]|nr:alpha/beta hydrolase [Deltaproteobacteria bacterium]